MQHLNDSAQKLNSMPAFEGRKLSASSMLVYAGSWADHEEFNVTAEEEEAADDYIERLAAELST